ncbi:unnamed protein product [Linum trigynum]|uniref:Uncharacterized protein n=1 Tax=Linum trigynum TaxID=586398 RepID=A0AAV2GHU8_9ROSI
MSEELKSMLPVWRRRNLNKQIGEAGGGGTKEMRIRGVREDEIFEYGGGRAAEGRVADFRLVVVEGGRRGWPRGGAGVGGRQD